MRIVPHFTDSGSAGKQLNFHHNMSTVVAALKYMTRPELNKQVGKQENSILDSASFEPKTLAPEATIFLKHCHSHKYQFYMLHSYEVKKKNSVASVRERTILTEQPPLVGEASANF
jgi:hypothetical protein